jgi:hypothetical protein
MGKISLDEWKKMRDEKSTPKKPKKQAKPKKSEKQEESVIQKKVAQFVSQASQHKDKNDHSRLRHNRERYEGFKIGHYIQTPPMLFTRDGHNMFMGDMYRGAAAFLVLGGPSLLDLNLDMLRHPGVLTMGVNNSVKTFRPNLWMCVDNPQSFIQSIWMDPTITKFVPYASAEKKLFDNNNWEMTEMVVGQCPNVFYYRRNEHFQAEQFLLEDTFNWGNHSNLCHCGYWRPDHKKAGKKVTVCPECGQREFGSRSVFLPAIRMLYFLGVRTVFLLGCDFKMEMGKKNYHFDQDRSKGSVRGNNSSYKMLQKRFSELKPIFEKLGFCVFNCNPESHLEVFPKVAFTDAVRVATAAMPDTENERTDGLYDRKKV